MVVTKLKLHYKSMIINLLSTKYIENETKYKTLKIKST